MTNEQSTAIAKRNAGHREWLNEQNFGVSKDDYLRCDDVDVLLDEVQRLQPFEGKARELRHQKDSGYDVMASSCVDDLCKLVDDD